MSDDLSNEIEDVISIPYNESNILCTKKDIQDICEKYGITIKVNNIELYRKAFTHKSYLKRNNIPPEMLAEAKLNMKDDLVELRDESYERLEILGDTVLKIIITDYLFERYPNENEGFITRLKTKIENRESFAKLSRNLGIGKFLIISQHIENINGRDSDKILEDTFEAFIGALFKDQEFEKLNNGFHMCREFITNILENKNHDIDYANLLYYDTNYKDQLLRYFHSEKWGHPIYREISHNGPAHSRKFRMGVISPKLTNYNDLSSDYMKQYVGLGEGNSKKKAEQEASLKALQHYRQILQLDLN